VSVRHYFQFSEKVIMKYQKSVKISRSIILFLAIVCGVSSIVKAAPGDLDLTFNPPVFSSSGSFFSIYANVLQPDGKIVAGGAFTGVNGINQISLARLNADGSRDTTFVSPFVTGSTQTTIFALALQTDGKILVGGTLVTPGGTKTLVRVNADGSLDTSFVVAPSSVFGQVSKIVVETNGQILASGAFSGVSRLNPNGSFVESIAMFTFNNIFKSFILQPDGKFVIGGMANFGGDATLRFVGANIDPTFRGGTNMILPIRGNLELQPDGKILMFGISGPVTVDGITRRGMLRLDSSGAADPSLDVGISGGSIQDIKLLANGKFIGGGFFFLPGDTNGYGFARFNADGTLDSTFPVTSPSRNTNEIVRSVNIQTNGKVIITGDFSQVAGVSRTLIARFEGDTSVVPNISIGNVSLNEGNIGTTAFNFTVSLSAATTQTVTVNYATADGTANAPTDYQAASGTLTFAPGEISKTITVLVNGDTTIEPNETFTVNLSGAVNGTILGGVGTGTIITDDVCLYSISPTSLTIGAGGGAGNTISVTAQAGCAYTAASNNSFITITSGASGSGNGTVIFAVAANSGAARIGTITVAGRTFTVNQAASPTFRRTPFDFDGDGKADVSIYRPSTGTWYIINSAGGVNYTQWGNSTDKIVPADYDGDGKADVAIYRPSTGTWYLLNSTGGITYTQWGFSTDIPVPADYDGDGKADIAIYRPSNGTWYILKSTGGVIYTQWGFSTDKPVPADYDGDGKADVAIYRPNTGTWYSLNSTTGYSQTQWGISTDIPVPADYDGDGKTDLAIYRPNTGTWYLLNSTTGVIYTQWGNSTDILVPADYDGDGKADIAVYRPSTGTWYIINSTGGVRYTQWGISTDKPIPNAFVP
jgi:uncharacterized delta-60 repeat protein